MDNQTELNSIYQKIDKTKDSNIDYNLEIENALENIKKGNFYNEDQAKEIAKKWEENNFFYLH